ncbi:unnamed protein product [Paramecium sonneborni]|uniref:Uncharacterized protein n=1 Tax=Paramecium sonneborni TaxID=65129 RepID=A0A8S1R6N0_9CILI|nr:unnamed protein product [Paramecium sonneborni]
MIGKLFIYKRLIGKHKWYLKKEYNYQNTIQNLPIYVELRIWFKKTFQQESQSLQFHKHNLQKSPFILCQ